ncbi:MAG: hypothetical protein JXQ71_05355 [Verrucomicrobia bacterium]|nr:hypothetical protein [Verrucomicrobiota bacterium]
MQFYEKMRATGHITLREFDATSGNFTLPIRSTPPPQAASMPSSFKKPDRPVWTRALPRSNDRAGLAARPVE